MEFLCYRALPETLRCPHMKQRRRSDQCVVLTYYTMQRLSLEAWRQLLSLMEILRLYSTADSECKCLFSPCQFVSSFWVSFGILTKRLKLDYCECCCGGRCLPVTQCHSTSHRWVLQTQNDMQTLTVRRHLATAHNLGFFNILSNSKFKGIYIF